MRPLKLTKQFKQHFKLAHKDPRKDTARLQAVIEQLQQQGSLPSEYSPHPLTGNWKPAWECHVQPDFLLIYEVNDDALKLLACGTHSDLFR